MVLSQTPDHTGLSVTAEDPVRGCGPGPTGGPFAHLVTGPGDDLPVADRLCGGCCSHLRHSFSQNIYHVAPYCCDHHVHTLTVTPGPCLLPVPTASSCVPSTLAFSDCPAKSCWPAPAPCARPLAGDPHSGPVQHEGGSTCGVPGMKWATGTQLPGYRGLSFTPRGRGLSLPEPVFCWTRGCGGRRL